MNEDYLGDGVYCSFDGFQVWIWTSNGITSSEKIALDSDTLNALVKYNLRVRTEALNRAVERQ
jgi:hypothetical protein